jgi:hypothetical protein
MKEVPFTIDDDGHIVSEGTKPATQPPREEQSGSEEKPESAVSTLSREFNAYLKALDEKNRAYGIKSYAKDSRDKGPPAAFFTSGEDTEEAFKP